MQSCEPCRKSKVACDHSVPCGRCVRRRRVDECYYHPSPLTRYRQETIATAAPATVPRGVVTSSLPNKDISPPSNEHFSGADGGDAVHTTQRALGTTPRASLPLPHRAESAPPLFDYAGVRSEKQGFFGFTSHTSIMTEDLTQLGITSTGLDQATSVHEKPIPYEKIASGCQVLSFLQNRPMIDRALDLFFKSIDCIHLHCGELIIRPWLSQLWLSHGETLENQDPWQIRQLCVLLFANTSKPQVFDGNTTARQWISSATGDHIRWGVIAMIANYVGSFAMVTSSSDPFFEEFDMDRKSLLDRMTEVSELCIGFCREGGLLDDGFLCALFEYYSIIKHTKGEASYASWCVGAELNSAFVAMGLHQEIKADAQVPFFLAELRKRLRSMVYTSEISTATFLGRPPRLSHRYINLDLPLDLTDTQLFSEDPRALATAIAKLDEHGYNRDEKIHLVSWIRPSISFMARREDILELSLGNFTPDEVRRNADLIQRKTQDHWATLPPAMLRLRDGAFGIESQTVLELHVQNIFRQVPHANSLLLHRVLMRKADTGPAGLIRTAQTIFSNVMRVYKRVEASAVTSFIYFLAVHGLRSAVILAIELLKQEQLPPGTREPLLPRSQTIQDLCIFSDKLTDLDPMFGDRDLCDKGQRLISRILDKILSPRNATVPQCQTCARPIQVLDTGDLAHAMLHDEFLPGAYSTGVVRLEERALYPALGLWPSLPPSTADCHRRWAEYRIQCMQ
ncbi:Fungal Zn(2)-Cys(6) binuclear cluster domain-containing protein [Penicillium ucsense]|uniref:Fungal Zn(2)-Cys(6) binuclear cluster domain-containing protein n=1 Tax=Penicillium ucsense TaxID=2839758 RepID=A0A8J8W2V8_9EURO|nr:Fungal Zn(2)-Cys(6) binuclear cluster domain-containing protein [Penicillium ucsense]KAF7736574.1 Fungal Zn(2)-Cys(6) binuclear cluster domain-containing protein [Penicillium ucsense]